ncbi:MAG: sigma-54 dependent transcriptional regulator [Desulfobacterales bacterium]
MPNFQSGIPGQSQPDGNGEQGAMQEKQTSLTEEMIGAGAAMQEVFRLLRQFADSDANVLVTGETGTGKELLAQILHKAGPRAAGPFVRVSCNEIPESLMETQLFGCAKGAFTGAEADRAGYFEAADRGTVFLDEIADIPLHIQAKFLRVADTGEFTRIGERIVRKTDIRIVSACNTDLAELIRAGKFREDLGFRLKGLTIRVPPLRERREDIPLLTEYFLKKFSQKKTLRICDEVHEFFSAHSWPGNVRQLKNVLEDMRQLCAKDVIALRGSRIWLRKQPGQTGESAEKESDKKKCACGIGRDRRQPFHRSPASGLQPEYPVPEDGGVQDWGCDLMMRTDVLDN